ncbi:DMT family transporter [Bacillus sp. CGMCC 1.16607]|uniref:DMT family transporter n=1 Tax=Bacillus sp. CGMCC 1.16607 TaxID=3351842 RepID=UPI00362A70B2
MKQSRRLGQLMIISGATLWGLSGPMIQWFFQHSEITSIDYLIVRLWIAGIFILGFLHFKKVPIFQLWKHPKDVIQLLLFSIIGMLGGQYVFIETVRISNAVTATLFQFLGPVLITIWVSLQNKKLPTSLQLLAVLAALFGTFFLITNGNAESIVLSNQAIIFGILTAVTFAFYTLQPNSLIKKWGTSIIVGWGMLLGGIVLFLLQPSFSLSNMIHHLTMGTGSMLILIIISGTLSFALYFGSLKYLSPMETSILSSIEPLVAALVSIIWLKETFGVFQLVGGMFIILAVVFLTIPEKEIQPKMVSKRAS